MTKYCGKFFFGGGKAEKKDRERARKESARATCGDSEQFSLSEKCCLEFLLLYSTAGRETRPQRRVTDTPGLGSVRLRVCLHRDAAQT